MNRQRRSSGRVMMVVKCPHCTADLAVPGQGPYRLPEHPTFAINKTWTEVDGEKRAFDYQVVCPLSGATFTLP